jgi:predicted thioesterase
VEIEVGRHAELTMVVGIEDTAAAMGSGSVEVLATPRIVAWVEAAAVAALADAIDTGSTSVGIRIELSHKAPAQIGAEVTATATVTDVEGRAVTFEVTAIANEVELAHGEHTRVVVDAARFGG